MYACIAPKMHILTESCRGRFELRTSSYQTKPMAATECCSCMSQRGIDEDMCPHPADGGCGGCKDPGTCPVFYNNNIGECTSKQVIESDSLDYVAGTYVVFPASPVCSTLDAVTNHMTTARRVKNRQR